MLHVEVRRRLAVHDPHGGVGHLSAASGLVCLGTLACVVADDELSLGVFDLADAGPGRLVSLFDGELPTTARERKAAKPDLEALAVLPAFAGHPHDALLALGSGSRDVRQRGALLPLGADARPQAPARSIDLTPLLQPLRAHFGSALNVEGAFVDGSMLRLLQRGNQGARANASIAFAWDDVARWLGGGAAPVPRAVTPFELGAIDGVPLGFTDGAALPDGGWVFCAAAEDTADSYLDGACAGSVVGRVDAGGAIVQLERLALACKVEGIAAAQDGDGIAMWMVTDPDDRSDAGLLLSAWLRNPA